MCLAIPGKIVAISGDSATVDYGSERRTGKLISEGFKTGDYCIIQGGIVLEKVPKKEAINALRLYHEAVG